MIVACLIVKDEAPVIERCLRSVLPYVDAAVIVDTGSSDDTLDHVRTICHESGIPNYTGQREWVNFAHNRNEVLDLARREFPDTGAYALHIDADEVLAEIPAPALELSALLDGYILPVSYAGTEYDRLALIRLDRPWRWVGVVHEYLELEGANIGRLNAPRIVVSHDGARSRDPETYAKDAALLEAELERNPGEPRTQFYLAQSYRDAGNQSSAYGMYLIRAANETGWWQERVVSLIKAGRIRQELGQNPLAHYLGAYALDPRRAEGLMLAAVYEREYGRPALALLYAREATQIIRPTEDVLFSEDWAYGVRAWEERGWAANACGHAAEGAQSLRKADELR